MGEPRDAAEPLVTFYKLIPEARAPQRADRSAGGTLPTRAFRHCEPATAAAGFGWYLFPPIDFSLVWDGTEVMWTHEGADGWYPLEAAQFPGFADHFDAHAPDDVKSFSPPFLGTGADAGIVQCWTGIFARTAPDWSLLVRPPANLPRRLGYELYEGIIETDHWFGPLFTNLRLTRTDRPIEIKKDYPLLQVQPIPRYVYANETLAAFRNFDDMTALTETDWQAFRDTVVAPNVAEVRPKGKYAAEARKKERGSKANAGGCPFAAAAAAKSATVVDANVANATDSRTAGAVGSKRRALDPAIG